MIARRIGGAAIDWLFPPACLACDAAVAEAQGLCSACWREAVFLDGAVCKRCGALSPYPEPAGWPDGPCADCPDRQTAFTQARAAMAYSGAGRELALSLKHRDRFDLAKPMGRWMARAGQPLRRLAPRLGAPVLAPAPLHWTRRAARRGDQAAALARQVARVWGAPLAEGALRRERATPPQAALDADARWANVADAFVVAEDFARDLAGRRVILIDDVFTTGATLDACARALRAAGVARVDALVFARPCRAALEPVASPPQTQLSAGEDDVAPLS